MAAAASKKRQLLLHHAPRWSPSITATGRFGAIISAQPAWLSDDNHEGQRTTRKAVEKRADEQLADR
jgi:hypothetical protein